MAPATVPKRLPNECVGSGPRLVLVHGFTQTRASMRPLAQRLAENFAVCAVDLPFHGGEAVPTESLEGAAALLGATGGRARYLGYSLGGRICLTLALEQPELVERLVLVGATPGIADEAERAARRADDEALAERLDPRNPGAVGVALEEFLAEWLATPLFAHLGPEQADLAARRANTPAGLAEALRHLGTGTQRPSHARLAELEMPVLLLAGARDTKFTAIATEMAVRIGANARVELVPDAGHAAPFEAPEYLAGIVTEFCRD